MVSGSGRCHRSMTIEAFAAYVAAGATRSRGSGRGAVTVREVAAMGCRYAACHDRRRARVGRQRGDRPRRRSSRVALIAELSCVTRGAARNYGASRHGAVSVGAPESGIGVRGRRWKPGDVLTREGRGLRERDVALRARGVRGGEVDRANTMTLEAPFRRGRAHGHPGCSGLGVARCTGWCPRAGRGHVAHVIETQVAAPHRPRRTPRHDFLNRPVVAGGAPDGLGPKRRTALDGAEVTRCARWEQRPVLLMVETRLLATEQRGAQERGEHQQDRGADRQRAALPPGIRRTAGGKRPNSSPRPNDRMARSVRRHWPQSNAAASGRR